MRKTEIYCQRTVNLIKEGSFKKKPVQISCFPLTERRRCEMKIFPSRMASFWRKLLTDGQRTDRQLSSVEFFISMARCRWQARLRWPEKKAAIKVNLGTRWGGVLTRSQHPVACARRYASDHRMHYNDYKLTTSMDYMRSTILQQMNFATKTSSTTWHPTIKGHFKFYGTVQKLTQCI